MKLLVTLLAPAVLITGCATAARKEVVVPSTVTLPALPSEFIPGPEPLPPLTKREPSELVRQGLEDDAAYAELAARYSRLRDLYNCIVAAVNEHKDASECVK